MKKSIEAILTKGLGEGYMGNIQIKKIDRAGFGFESSDYIGPEGHYHDEWIAHQNGGGQDLGEDTVGNLATRVYAGGTLEDEKLKKLGITGKDVMEKLLFFVNQQGEKTRLDENTESIEGDWVYKHVVLEKSKDIPVCVSRETIHYQEYLVFIHFHINSPVR